MNEDMQNVYIGDKSLRELECLWECDVEDDDFYDVIAYNISQQAPQYLLQHMSEYSGARLRGAIFGLGLSPLKDKEQERILTSFLMSNDPVIVAEAIDALRNSELVNHWELISPFIQHESPFVRGAVLRYGRGVLAIEQALQLLTDALADSSYIVRENAIDELADLRDKTAVRSILPFLNDPNEDVRMAARTALNSLGRLASS